MPADAVGAQAKARANVIQEMLRFILQTQSSCANALGAFIAYKWAVSNSVIWQPKALNIPRVQLRRVVN